MSYGIYDASIPIFRRGLANIAKILKKAEANAIERGFPPETLLTQRLAPDMHPLPQQIQIATDAAKGVGARLSGIEPPSFPDTETTFAELDARIAKTDAFLAGLDPAAFAGAEDRMVTLKAGVGSFELSGRDYLSGFAMPNFFFHLTTAYAILRHNGVPLGKRDFVGL